MGSSTVMMWSSRCLVELADHGGEGGGLAGADRAGDEDEAVVVGEELADGLEVAQAEVVELGDAWRGPCGRQPAAPFLWNIRLTR
jgi:hypothetical protein